MFAWSWYFKQPWYARTFIKFMYYCRSTSLDVPFVGTARYGEEGSVQRLSLRTRLPPFNYLCLTLGIALSNTSLLTLSLIALLTGSTSLLTLSLIALLTGSTSSIANIRRNSTTISIFDNSLTRENVSSKVTHQIVMEWCKKIADVDFEIILFRFLWATYTFYGNKNNILNGLQGTGIPRHEVCIPHRIPRACEQQGWRKRKK